MKFKRRRMEIQYPHYPRLTSLLTLKRMVGVNFTLLMPD